MPTPSAASARGYVAAFGAAGDDPLYESVSAGRKTQGMEHWLPLFYERLDTLFDYLPRCLVMLGHQAEEAKAARLELVRDYYETREQFRHAEGRQARHQGAALQAAEARDAVSDAMPTGKRLWPSTSCASFAVPGAESTNSVDAGGNQGRDFAPERQGGNLNVFQAAADHLKALQAGGKRRAGGKLDRRFGRAHGRGDVGSRRHTDPESRRLAGSAEAGHSRLRHRLSGIERGFEAPDFAILSEQDVLGDRMVRAQAARAGRRISSPRHRR